MHLPSSASASHTTLRVVLLVCGSLKDFEDLPKHLHLKLTIGLHRTLIAKCPLFLEFDCHTIMRTLRLLRPCTLPPETVVIRQGCEHTSMFWISRGMCWVIDISKRNADGKPHCDATLGDQEFFGDEAVMSDQLVCAARSVVTKSYCVLMERTSQLASMRQPPGYRLPYALSSRTLLLTQTSPDPHSPPQSHVPTIDQLTRGLDHKQVS